MGICLLNQKNYQAALKSFDQAVSLSPSESKFFSNRGECRRLAGKFKEGLEDLERALELDGKSAIYWHNKGYILEKM